MTRTRTPVSGDSRSDARAPSAIPAASASAAALVGEREAHGKRRRVSGPSTLGMNSAAAESGANAGDEFPRFLTRTSVQAASSLGRERCTADRKSAGASDALEAPVMIGGPSRTRTLDPLIKRNSQ